MLKIDRKGAWTWSELEKWANRDWTSESQNGRSVVHTDSLSRRASEKLPWGAIRPPWKANPPPTKTVCAFTAPEHSEAPASA